MWPSDVGVSLEEQGDVIRYLNALVFVFGSRIKIAPFNPNVCFALGFEPKQKIARLGHFAGMKLSRYHVLRTFMLAQIMVMNHLCVGRAENLYFNIWCLISEILGLEWPQIWISKTLRSIPRKHASTFECLQADRESA